MIKFTSTDFSITAGRGAGRREISGVAVPYNVEATVASGQAVIIKPGALPVEGKAPRLFMYHDSTMPVGVVTERVDTQDGMMFTAKVSASSQGQDAMTLLSEGVIDQVSIGINPTKFSYNDEGTMIVEAADWIELSLVPVGAFGDAAAITEVAASIHQEPEEIGNTEQETPQEETPAMENAPVVEAAAVEATIPTAPIPAQAKRKFSMPSAGEYLAAFHAGGDVWRKVNDAAVEAMRDKQTALQAAAGTGGNTNTENTPGLLPVPVLGPVFQDLNYIRPVVAAIGARAMPDGGNQKTFIRPTWTTHTSVAAQASELAAVSATSPVIASNVVAKTTLAGQVTLSVQDVDFTSPAAMEIILRDLAGEYLLKSDDVAADAITSGASASGSTWTYNTTDPSTLIAAIYDAAVDILSASNFLPDHIFVSPNVYKLLGQQLDAEKRPVFPYAGAAGLMGVNGMGTANVTQMNTFNPLGLNLVVDRNFATNTMVVAKGSAIEFYEQVRGLMSVEAPSTLGRTFSYYGYVATFIADSDIVKSIIVSP